MNDISKCLYGKLVTLDWPKELTKTLRPELRRSALPVKKKCEKMRQGLFLIIPNVPHAVAIL